MSPKDYYYRTFPTHLTEFVQKFKGGRKRKSAGVYIPTEEFTRENLSHLSREEYSYFIYSLAFTLLLDEIMYKFFPSDYPMFQKVTLYPKREYGISNVYIDPWTLISKLTTLRNFDLFLAFFIKEMEIFFKTTPFEYANWKEVKKAILRDKDLSRGEEGTIFMSLI